MRTVIFALFGVSIGCVNHLYKESIQDAYDANLGALRAYQMTPVDDAGKGEGARAFDKSVYCSTLGILRNEKQPLPDGGLPCPQAKK
jgi:hypothetical protein